MGRQKKIEKLSLVCLQKRLVGMMGGEAREAGMSVRDSKSRALLVKLRSLDLILVSLKDSNHFIWPDLPF